MNKRYSAVSFLPLCSAALALTILLHPVSAISNEKLPDPASSVELVIKGDLEKTNADNEARFDISMLQALPRTEFTTMTPWDEGLQHFAGVRVSDLLKYVGAKTQDFKAVGYDDYKFDVTDVDFEKFPVIIAYEHNGHPISLRKLGPLRIIFPISDYPELADQIYEASAVWQLVEMQLL